MEMKIYKMRLLCLVCLLMVLMPGCLRQKESVPAAEIKTFRSGSLHVKPNREAPRTIYIDVRNAAGLHPLHVQTLGTALNGEEFQVTESPSKAGYILHLSLLQEGPVDSAMLEKLVEAGYGSEARFSGAGSTGMLADALLVQRMVPSSKRPSRERLKNISKRNALDSTQMRLGLLLPGNDIENPGDHAMFSDALVKEIIRAISFDERADAGY